MADLPATIGDEVLRRLYQYWDAKRAGRRFPARSDIDPTELSYALGWLNLIDVLHDPLRFRYRLQGTMLVRHTGIEMTGKFLDEHPQPEFRRHLARSWQKIVESGEPEQSFMTSIWTRRRSASKACVCPCRPTATASTC
jgi:hypothetical protein